MTTDWRNDLGFTERSLVTLDIITVLKSSPNPPADIFAFAQSIESVAFEAATSRTHYSQLVQDKLAELSPPPINPHHAPHLPESNHPPIGEYTNPHHELTTLSSSIYKARAPNGEVVCLKLTQPPCPAPHDPVHEAKLLREMKHENIIPFLDSFRDEGSASLVLVMPWASYSFYELIHDERTPVKMLKKAVYHVADALGYLHERGIIHRDVKPSNILLRSIDPVHPVLIDFSIAYSDMSQEKPDKKYSEVGTTSYRAPELLFSYQSYGAEIDLWALGCIVAQILLRGKELFDAGDLGSELALIASIFRTMGTPDEEVWPGVKNLPDWGKVEFVKFERKPWEEVLGSGDDAGRDLVDKLVRWEGRLPAREVMQHEWFGPEK